MLTASLLCTAIAAAANWWSRIRPTGNLELFSKPATTIFVIWVAIASDGPRPATILALIGLLFCLVGDVALLPLVDRFIVGLAAFLIGHIFFVAMFAVLGLRHLSWGVPAAAVVIALGWGVARPIVAGAAANKPQLQIPVVAYFAVISTMFIVAAMTGNGWAIAGASAFVISDSLLGRGEFVRELRWMHVAIMVTYHAALLGLALSLAL